MLPKVKLVFDRKKVSGAKNEGDVEVYVYHNTKKRYLSTGVRVRKREYRDGVVSCRADAVELNKRLQWCVRHIQEQVNEMVENDCVNLSALSINVTDRNGNFFDWVEERISQRDIKPNTKRKLQSVVNVLRREKIFNTFADITLSNIQKLDVAIRSCTASTRRIYHTNLKSFIKMAMNEDLVTKNPYDKFELPKENRIKSIKYLTEDELRIIENAEVNRKLRFTRDIFLLGCYTGLRHSDIRQITKANYCQRDGVKWLIGEQQKTGNNYNVVLLPESERILNEWEWDMDQVSLPNIDINLKRLACLCGLGRNLTMHMSRHTFATRALSKGVRIEVVSKMLGHTDIKMTQVYAKVLQQDVAKGFELLLE